MSLDNNTLPPTKSSRISKALPFAAMVLALCLSAMPVRALAQVETVLYSFTNCTGGSICDGSNPDGLTLGPDGNLYGVSQGGSIYSGQYGTVFQISPTGSFSTLYLFSDCMLSCDGADPSGSLVLGGDGNLYGPTFKGGTAGEGTVYKITTSGVLTTLHSFFTGTDSSEPVSNLIPISNGSFMGITDGGYTARNFGAVYSISATGSVSVLYSFTSCLNSSNCDGGTPADLIAGSDGNFYGTTISGGKFNPSGASNDGNGTIFKITPEGSFSTLYVFSNCAQTANCDGSSPTTLVQASDGNIYGVTSTGGASGNGTIFKLASDGTVTTLYSFTNCASSSNCDGADPEGIIQAADGDLYGITGIGGVASVGTVFRITAAGQFSTIYSFASCYGQVKCDGAGPQGGLLELSPDVFYGTTQGGGANFDGTIYKLDLNSGVPSAPTGLTANSGNGQITLNWNAAGAATSYNVYEGTSAGRESATAVITGLTTTSTTVTGLNNGTTYYFVVKGINASGTSPASNESSATPSTPIPAAPSDLTAVSGDNEVSLSWDAASNAFSYNVYEGSVAGGESATPVMSGVTTTATTITGLMNGTGYYFVVKGVGASGTGPSSNEVFAAPVAASSSSGSGSSSSSSGGGSSGSGGGAVSLPILIGLGVAAAFRRRRRQALEHF